MSCRTRGTTTSHPFLLSSPRPCVHPSSAVHILQAGIAKTASTRPEDGGRDRPSAPQGNVEHLQTRVLDLEEQVGALLIVCKKDIPHECDMALEGRKKIAQA